MFALCEKKYLPNTDVFEIENIQDTVVEVLAKEGETRAVIAYCEYRYQHKLEREQRVKKAYEEKLMAKNVVNQNANIGRLEWALEAVKACGITKDDMWFPTDSVRLSRQTTIYNTIIE